MIRFFSNSLDFSFKHQPSIKSWIKNYLSISGYKVGDINVIFCSDNYLLDINKQFLSHDYYTDIITFDYTSDKKVSGELYISIDTVASNAHFYSQPFTRELYRVIIHGILHMTGYDDLTEMQQNIIHEKEDDLLALLDLSSLEQSYSADGN